MATNFKYASISDLTKYFGRVSDFDSKKSVYGWTQESNLDDYGGTSNLNVWYANNTGLVTQLYINGQEITNLNSNLTTQKTLLNGTMADASTAALVDSSTGIEANDIVKINNEYMHITSIADSTTIGFAGTNRHLFNTHALNHVDDSKVYLVVEDTDIDVADYNWFFYDADLDMCVVSISNDVNPNDLITEAGEDYTTFMNQALVDASLELHNYLDMRYSTPLEKIKQTDIDTASVSIAEEYDPIIIKSVCYIAAANLIRAKEGASEEADYYMSQVTNAERQGIIDRLNDGTLKLSHEVDANDKKGSIRHRSVAGTMDLVELAGEYTGELYDLLKVEIEATGAYGTGTFKVHYLSNDQLFGAVSSAEKITGGLQHIHSGLYGRFQGASATDGDIWEIEVFGSHRKQTNKSNATIEMTR